MVYCSNCGQKLEENYNFCPKCGTKTGVGIAAGAYDPWEGVRDGWSKAMEEMDKAFTKASEETRKAFEGAKKETRWQDVRGTLATAMDEMSKAFTKASEETRKAYEEAKKEGKWQVSSRKRIECPNCGAPNMTGSKFCSKCGKPLP